MQYTGKGSIIVEFSTLCLLNAAIVHVCTCHVDYTPTHTHTHTHTQSTLDYSNAHGTCITHILYAMHLTCSVVLLLFGSSAFGGGDDTADQNPFDSTPAAAAPAADEGNPFGGGDAPADEANRKFTLEVYHENDCVVQRIVVIGSILVLWTTDTTLDYSNTVPFYRLHITYMLYASNVFRRPSPFCLIL